MPRTFIILALLAGCVDPEDVCAQAGSMTPTVEVGTGETEFEPLPDEPLRGYFGSQGGYHLWISLRTTGIAPTRPGASARHPPPAITMELVDKGSARQQRSRSTPELWCDTRRSAPKAWRATSSG